MSDDVYTYPPDFLVLRNRLDIRDAALLSEIEREYTLFRMMDGVPKGAFDLRHLCLIHRHIFQDVYDWAGDIRTVEISKGNSHFQFRRFIEAGMDDIHRRLVERDFLKGLDIVAFATEAGSIMGDVNYVHPFRDGNGRTQLAYFRQLAEQAGYWFDPNHLEPDAWIAASVAAHHANYAPMGRCILEALTVAPADAGF
ncbi:MULTISPECIES: Fic/DOC family protein [unclassified Aureimonas]|uniref:Fic/DOC family protein n=1 Tax=unclassified Aureimonas TaxID=2615206 RepID=UPI0006F5BCC8|nr:MULTISPECIES: Fic family protein [unclassified Aureimonas]KQT64475.1 cell division protein [Aureimonas sp. Leaf427]KQT81663.1 cell division protein [Aureimonas sp. Leaf460]